MKSARGESKRPIPSEEKKLVNLIDELHNFFTSEEMIDDMAESFCDQELPINDLKERLHNYDYIIDDEELMENVMAEMTSMEPRCSLTAEKMRLLTRGELDRVANYVKSLIIFDGKNHADISQWSKGLHVDQIARTIIKVVNVWENSVLATAYSSLSSSSSSSNLFRRGISGSIDKQKILPREIKASLESNLPFLLGVTTENLSEVYKKFLTELRRTNAIGLGPTPEQLNNALVSIDIIRTITDNRPEEQTEEDKGEGEDKVEGEEAEGDLEDNYDNYYYSLHHFY